MKKNNMGNNSGNIAIGGILTECNEFSINLMTKENFERYEYYESNKILNLKSGVVGGMLSALVGSSFNISPTVFASCSPGGVIEDKCYFDIKEKILNGIKNIENLKAVLLPLHGAAVTESIGDLEGDLITSIRKIIGNDKPIVVTLDLHAHVTKEMIENSSAILAWEQYPHLDPYETGVRGSKLLREILEKNIKPKMFFSKTPILHSAINASTFGKTPFAEIMRDLKEEEKNNTHILSTSLIHVNPYIDQNNMGGGTIIITNNDIEIAKTLSLQFTKNYWDRRFEFEPVLYSPQDAILDGLDKNSNVLLVETADACGGGAVGDSVQTLKKLIISAPNEKSLTHVVDPKAAAQCVESGIGKEIKILLGHQIDKQWGNPVEIKVKIEKITDGKFIYNGGIWDKTVGEMGPTALVSIGNIQILVSSFGTYEWNCEQFLSFDLKLGEYKFLVVKNPMNYKNTFSHIKNIYILDTAGPTPATCKHLRFKKMFTYFPKQLDLKFEDVLLEYNN